MKCLCDLADEQFSDCQDFAADSTRFQAPLTPSMYGQGRETGSSPPLRRQSRTSPSSLLASTSTPKKILTSASLSLNITVSVVLVLIVMGCATLTAAAPAPADTRTAATSRAVASASAAPHQGNVGPRAPPGGISNGRNARQLSPEAGYNRIKRSASPYFTYGGYPTDVGGSGYPPYWVGRKSWNYSKFGNSGDIPFTVRIMLDALSTHTRPIVDVG